MPKYTDMPLDDLVALERKILSEHRHLLTDNSNDDSHDKFVDALRATEFNHVCAEIWHRSGQ